MATETHRMQPVRDLIERVETTLDEAGDRVATLLDDGEIKRRLSDAVDALDDVRVELLRRLRGKPDTTELTDTSELTEMTVKELHELAREREIPGRSSMNKAELVDALGQR